MIIITLRNIKELNLPLDNTSKILERGSSAQVLKELEKKYGYNLCLACYRELYKGFYAYRNNTYSIIPEEDMNKWCTNYEVYVRSSIEYKFWIWFYKIKKKIK